MFFHDTLHLQASFKRLRLSQHQTPPHAILDVAMCSHRCLEDHFFFVLASDTCGCNGFKSMKMSKEQVWNRHKMIQTTKSHSQMGTLRRHKTFNNHLAVAKLNTFDLSDLATFVEPHHGGTAGPAWLQRSGFFSLRSGRHATDGIKEFLKIILSVWLDLWPQRRNCSKPSFWRGMRRQTAHWGTMQLNAILEGLMMSIIFLCL